MKPYAHLLSFALAAAVLSAPAARALTVDTWLSLPLNPSVITLQKDGIAKRAPNSTATLTSSSLSNLAAGTGVRLRGTITPTVTGTYTLAIAGSRNTTLWLSPSSSRFTKQPIAWHYEPTNALQWTKFTSQQSAPVVLTAGTSYYIEAQVMASTTGGHISLGWKTPGSTTLASIPSANLAPLAPDPADVSGNCLPDAWETEKGLGQSTLPGALAEHGDPDKDGRSNYDEYRSGTDPLFAEAFSGGLTRDIWTELQGQQVSRLTGSRSRFLSHPNATTHVPRISANSPNSPEGKNYGARYHGYLIAPVTGVYHLWVAGDDEAELWFADGTVTHPATASPLTNQSGKELLAHTRNPGGSYSSSPWDYDLIPSQRTRALHLTAGQPYFIEVLHKNESILGNHVSLAWQFPGQPRAVVPATAFRGSLPESTDVDNDSLPDAWEISVGLITWNNGAFDGKEGQYGDHDNDGLSNLTEFQLRTNPKAADTDSDGISDSEEINRYRSNPLVSNTIATNLQSTLILRNPSASSFPWKTNTNGTITAHERRGWLEWKFTVAQGQQGIHEIRLLAGASGPNIAIPLSFHIDGHLVGRQSVTWVANQSTTVTQLTPFLAAGVHTLRIQNHNVRAGLRMNMNSLTIHRIGGADANSNGIADWAEARLAADNVLYTVPTQSLTSPAYIEGTTSNPAALILTQAAPGGTAVPLPAQRGCDGIFFAEAPLDPSAPTNVSVSFQNGGAPETHSIAWVASNILATSSMTIRQGDSLRLTAHDPAAAPSGTFTLGGGSLLPIIPTGSHNSAEPLILKFDQPGTHIITATWTPADGAIQTATLTLKVAAADFGSAFILQTYNRRTWTVAGVQGMDIQADTSLNWREATATEATTTRSFLANAYHAGEYRVVARIPETGRIIAVGEVSAFSLARATATADAQVVQVRPDGSKVIRFTVVAENLPSNAEIRIRMNYQGTVFPDGSRDFILRPSDFSSNGVANVLVETSSDPPQLCHSMHAVLLD